jgi:F-type H+-transporting ATPase subunit delta
MAEIATIARPYAEALFKASSENMGSVCAWLDELAVIAADKNLQSLDASPSASSGQVFDLVRSVAKSTLDVHAQNFLRTVIENGRLAALPEVAAQFRALVNQQAGIFDATVQSAFPLDAAALLELSGSLEKRFARKLKLSVVTDASLIGGVRVVVGDEVLDTSVKARLEQMKVALTA